MDYEAATEIRDALAHLTEQVKGVRDAILMLAAVWYGLSPDGVSLDGRASARAYVDAEYNKIVNGE